MKQNKTDQFYKTIMEASESRRNRTRSLPGSGDEEEVDNLDDMLSGNSKNGVVSFAAKKKAEAAKEVAEVDPDASVSEIEDMDTLNSIKNGRFGRKSKKAMVDGEESAIDDVDDFDGLISKNYNPEDAPAVAAFEGTDLPVYNLKTVDLYLQYAYTSKMPLLLYGDPGMGKSSIIEDFAKNIAKAKNKKYMNWRKDISGVNKKAAIENPEEYFCLVDVRAAELEPTDFAGIPDIASRQEWLETKQHKWIYFMGLPNTDGILFLDEMNQATEQTMNALFSLVLDRTAGETAFAPDWLVLAAGNLGKAFGNQDVKAALTNRFKAGVLVVEPKEWIKWAQIAKVNKYIIGYVQADPSNNFYYKPRNRGDAFPSPRSVTSFSKELDYFLRKYARDVKRGRGNPVELSTLIEGSAAGYCGIVWARGFSVYLNHIMNFDLNEIVKNPTEYLSVNKVEQIWAIVMYIVNKVEKVAPWMAAHPFAGTPKSKEPIDPFAELVMKAVVTVSIHLTAQEHKAIFFNQIINEIEHKALAAILEYLSGGNYDPALKAEFMTSLDEIKAVISKNKENEEQYKDMFIEDDGIDLDDGSIADDGSL